MKSARTYAPLELFLSNRKVPEKVACISQIYNMCTSKSKFQVLHVQLFPAFALHLLEISNLQPCQTISIRAQLKQLNQRTNNTEIIQVSCPHQNYQRRGHSQEQKGLKLVSKVTQVDQTKLALNGILFSPNCNVSYHYLFYNPNLTGQHEYIKSLDTYWVE